MATNPGTTTREECINRNILECKVINHHPFDNQKQVLIETYWNVKTEKPLLYVYRYLVLIETYWNVKLSDCMYYSHQTPY